MVSIDPHKSFLNITCTFQSLSRYFFLDSIHLLQLFDIVLVDNIILILFTFAKH